MPRDNIDRPDSAAEIREGLKNPFAVPKAQDAKLRFVFMSGVPRVLRRLSRTEQPSGARRPTKGIPGEAACMKLALRQVTAGPGLYSGHIADE